MDMEPGEIQFLMDRFGAYVRSFSAMLMVGALNQQAATEGKPPAVSANDIREIIQGGWQS